MTEEQMKALDSSAYEALKKVAKKQKIDFNQLPKWIIELMLDSFMAGIDVFVKEIEKGEGLQVVFPKK